MRNNYQVQFSSLRPYLLWKHKVYLLASTGAGLTFLRWKCFQGDGFSDKKVFFHAVFLSIYCTTERSRGSLILIMYACFVAGNNFTPQRQPMHIIKNLCQNLVKNVVGIATIPSYHAIAFGMTRDFLPFTRLPIPQQGTPGYNVILVAWTASYLLLGCLWEIMLKLEPLVTMIQDKVIIKINILQVNIGEWQSSQGGGYYSPYSPSLRRMVVLV